MNHLRQRIGEAGPVVRACDGTPAIKCPGDWGGPIVQRFVLPIDAERGPMYTGMPVVFLTLSGGGKRWYRSGGRVLALDAGPYIDTYGERYERDHASWKGEAGESIGVRIPPRTVQRFIPDAAAHFDLATCYNVVDDRLASLIRGLADELQAGCPNGRMYAEGLSLAVLGWLSQHYTVKRTTGPRSGGLLPTQRKRVYEYIDANIGADIGIVGLATLIGVSPNHFTRLFKTSVGMPPYQFLVRRRVELAALVLREEKEHPIADIALAHGFSSQAHFTQTFRRLKGVTPARWRRQ